MEKSRSAGFTLVEVMIAMAIMGVLVALVAQSISSAVQTKKKMNAIIEAQSTMFDTIRIIKRDVERAFHYQDVFYQIERKSIEELNKELGKKNNPAPGGTPAPQKRSQGEAIPLPREPRQMTAFIGEKESMHFTSLNNVRTRYNVQESDQMEVGYFVDSCTSRRKKKKSTRCLFRRTNPYIDDDIEKDGRKMVVAEDVTLFELQYRSDLEDAEWSNEWKSTRNGRPQHQNKFPHLVKMKLEIYDEDSKEGRKLSEEIVMPIHFPNNTQFFKPEAKRARRR